MNKLRKILSSGGLALLVALRRDTPSFNNRLNAVSKANDDIQEYLGENPEEVSIKLIELLGDLDWAIKDMRR
jgi:hypothetical protein